MIMMTPTKRVEIATELCAALVVTLKGQFIPENIVRAAYVLADELIKQGGHAILKP